MDWSSVTSNLIVPTLIALATFAWSKIRGEKTASWSDTIEGLGSQLVHQLVIGALGTLSDARVATLTAQGVDYIGRGLVKLGIPINSITQPLITAAVQTAIGEALAELRALDTTNAANLDVLAKESAAAAGSFATAEAEGRARVAGMKDLIDTTPDAPTAPTAPEQAK